MGLGREERGRVGGRGWKNDEGVQVGGADGLGQMWERCGCAWMGLHCMNSWFKGRASRVVCEWKCFQARQRPNNCAYNL